jgi:hypothetical protein
VPSAQAHRHGYHDADGDAVTSAPILLVDIDRALEDSAGVADAGIDAPIREWRDQLAVALESLAYAGAVLSADVGILRHSLSADPDGSRALVADLPQAMSSRPWGKGWSAPCGTEGHSRADWEIFARSDRLMSTHQEMARIDLSSRDDVSRVIGGMESQLTDLARRQEAVEGRLREIRAAIVRQYEEGSIRTEDWLG